MSRSSEESWDRVRSRRLDESLKVRREKDLLARKALAYDTLVARLARVPQAHDDLHRITVRELRAMLTLK